MPSGTVFSVRSQRIRRAPLRTRILALTALLALAVTYLTPLVNVEWAAWRHDHGHLTTNGVVAPHEHPWDHDHAASTSGEATDEATEGEIVFTPNSESTPGMTALWAPASIAIVATLIASIVLLIAAVKPAGYALVPAPPPPRSSLSTI